MRTRVALVSTLALALGVGSSAQAYSALMLEGNISLAEYPEMSKINKIGNFTFDWEKTADRNLADLDDVDILWIGQGEICENAYFILPEGEQAILDFVEDGGICITVGQDSDGGRECETGWFPGTMTGVERGSLEAFQETGDPATGDMFTVSNAVDAAHHDDTWSDLDTDFVLLATINNGLDISVGLFDHGVGTYIITGIENEGAADVVVNLPLMENILLYAADLLSTQDVEARGKLALSWGEVKGDR